MDPATNPGPASEVAALTARLRAFRDERDWGQFHNAKDLAVALSIEASELLECYLWKDPAQADPAKVREELADVFAYALLLADRHGLDVAQISGIQTVVNDRGDFIEPSV